MIDRLGHSATAYEAAKERLERKFGARRRQIALHLEELEQFRQIRPGNAKDIEEFADLLDIAMIRAGHHHELGDGSLYNKMQCKIPETMLARYQRWMFENSKEESVISLRTWVLQEAEFQTIASEKVRGVEGKLSVEPTRSRPRHGNQRTFFGETNEGRKPQKLHCQECGKKQAIWNCRDLIQKSVPERWSVAKRHQLCFRCLGQGHAGKSCPRSRPCG